MTLRRVLLACSVLSLSGALSGCIAAAIPVLAAGGMVARDTTPDDAGSEVTPIVEVQPKPPGSRGHCGELKAKASSWGVRVSTPVSLS